MIYVLLLLSRDTARAVWYVCLFIAIVLPGEDVLAFPWTVAL